ncbi:hypothetical protein D3C73_1067150 [compost metagenome]
MYSTEVSTLGVDVGDCLGDHVNSVLRGGGSAHVTVGYRSNCRALGSGTEHGGYGSTAQRVAGGGVQRNGACGNDRGSHGQCSWTSVCTGTIFYRNLDTSVCIGITAIKQQVLTSIGFHRQALGRRIVVNADTQFSGVGLQLISQIGSAGYTHKADLRTIHSQVELGRSCSSSCHVKFDFSASGCAQTTYSAVQLSSNAPS